MKETTDVSLESVRERERESYTLLNQRIALKIDVLKKIAIEPE